MSTVFEPPSVRPSTSPSQRLRATMAAARVAFCSFGVRKTLTPQQKALATGTFGAEGQYLSAGNAGSTVWWTPQIDYLGHRIATHSGCWAD